MTNKSRRKEKQISDDVLYKLSKKDIRSFIKKERRHDNLSKMRKVKEQNFVWRTTLFICGGLNLIFLLLALWGNN